MAMHGWTRVPSCEAIYNGERGTIGWTFAVWDKIWFQPQAGGSEIILCEDWYSACKSYYYQEATPKYIEPARKQRQEND